MLGGYVDVKNRGFNETISSNNNKTNVSKIRWDANYNGNHGNMTLDISKNGRKITSDDSRLGDIHVRISYVLLPLRSRSPYLLLDPHPPPSPCRSPSG